MSESAAYHWQKHRDQPNQQNQGHDDLDHEPDPGKRRRPRNDGNNPPDHTEDDSDDEQGYEQADESR